jgi:hypothetical protein
LARQRRILHRSERSGKKAFVLFAIRYTVTSGGSSSADKTNALEPERFHKVFPALPGVNRGFPGAVGFGKRRLQPFTLDVKFA